eukprot:gene50470-68621_t
MRARSPFPQPLVLGYSNGNGAHYVGMPGEKARGGYEAGVAGAGTEAWPRSGEEGRARSEILHVDDAIGIGEREGAGVDLGETKAGGAVDDLVNAVNPVVHQHAAFGAGVANAGDADGVDEGGNAFVGFGGRRCRCRGGRWRGDGGRRGIHDRG